MFTILFLCLLFYLYIFFIEVFFMFDLIVNKIIKYLSICLLIISFVILSLFIFPPSFADDNVSILALPYSPNDMSSLPMIMGSSETACSYYDDELLYCFCYPTYSGSDRYNVLVCYDSTSSNSPNTFYKYSSGTVSTPSPTWTTNSTFNVKYNAYWANFPSSNINLDNVPVFSDLNTGLAAVRDYIDNPPSPEPSLYEGMNIPVGYIARIRVTNGSKFTMLTTMGTDNISFQDKWVYTSQWYKFNDSSDPSVILSSDGITIPWARYGNLNLLGQTNKAQYTITSTVGSYVWVYNPAYMVGQNADLYDTKLNSSIQLVDVQNIDQVRIFALKSSYGFNGVVSSTSTGSGITYNPDNDTWVDDEGNTVTPSDYGDTNVPTTGATLIQQFDNLLSNLINRIERLLVAPVDYINSLISSANQFFLWLRGLWSWLPGPVIESITAVLIVMCTVGALKLLWR